LARKIVQAVAETPRTLFWENFGNRNEEADF
jgi:hypothetical protein